MKSVCYHGVGDICVEGISELICKKFIAAQKKISYYDIDNRTILRKKKIM